MVFVVRELRNSLHDQRSPRISSRQQSPAITTRMPHEEYMRKVQIPVLYKHFCYLKKILPKLHPYHIHTVTAGRDKCVHLFRNTGVSPILQFPWASCKLFPHASPASLHCITCTLISVSVCLVETIKGGAGGRCVCVCLRVCVCKAGRKQRSLQRH